MNLSYPATANRSIERNPVLWSSCIPHQQFKGGISVVDPKSPHFQWAFPNSDSKVFGKKDRCIHKRLGSNLSGNSNRRVMDFTGTTSSYKCIGNEDRKASFASISQAFSDESYLFPNRQYNRLVLSCEDGGTKKKYLIDLAEEIWQYLLHHGITITTACLPSSMKGGGRLAVKKRKRPFKVGTPSISISEYFSKENQRWIFLLLDCQHNFHCTLHGN